MKFWLDIDVHCDSLRPSTALPLRRDMHWHPRFPTLITMGALLGLALAVALLRVLPEDQFLFVPGGAFLGLLTMAFVGNSKR
jgi:hypothetical protein